MTTPCTLMEGVVFRSKNRADQGGRTRRVLATSLRTARITKNRRGAAASAQGALLRFLNESYVRGCRRPRQRSKADRHPIGQRSAICRLAEDQIHHPIPDENRSDDHLLRRRHAQPLEELKVERA